MAPTIRIDDEVYAWLQNQGTAFEDTPNSVLRRVAKFDDEPNQNSNRHQAEHKVKSNGSSSQIENEANFETKNVRINGRQLNEQWNVGARHSLFHKGGTWYNNLTSFPGALFDPNGFVMFDSVSEYRGCPGVSVEKETNVPKGISKLPGYVRKI
jgi:hypothetical protein